MSNLRDINTNFHNILLDLNNIKRIDNAKKTKPYKTNLSAVKNIHSEKRGIERIKEIMNKYNPQTKQSEKSRNKNVLDLKKSTTTASHKLNQPFKKAA